MTNSRILHLAYKEALRLWICEKDKLEHNPDNRITKSKERRYW